jgi:O-antigen ligase
MLLVVLLIVLAVLFVASVRRPLIGVLAMIASLPIEYFFMGNLPPGVTVGRAVGVCAMAGWLVNRRKSRTSPFSSNRALFISSILFIGVTLIAALFAKNPAIALFQSIRIGMLLALGIMVGDLIRTRQDLISLCWVTVLAAAVGAGVVLLQFGAYQEGAEMVGNVYDARQGVRFEGLTSNANSLGINLLSGIPFLFFLFFTSQRSWVRLLCMGLLGLSAFVLVLTVSRSTIYPLAIYIAATYVLHRRMGKHLVAENVMIAIAVLMLGIAVLKSSAYVWERISRPVVDLHSDTSFEHRMRILSQGPRIMIISPIFGVGLSNTRQYLMHMDAHDTISSLLGETGILGTLLFAAFCVAVLRLQIGLFRRARMAGDMFQQELAVVLTGVVFILMVWMPVKVIFYQRLFWLWAGLVAWMDAGLPPLGMRRTAGVPRPSPGWGTALPLIRPVFPADVEEKCEPWRRA